MIALWPSWSGAPDQTVDLIQTHSSPLVERVPASEFLGYFLAAPETIERYHYKKERTSRRIEPRQIHGKTCLLHVQ